jgi:hypothetical protein
MLDQQSPELLSGPHEQARIAGPPARTTGPQAKPAGLHKAAPDAAFRDLMVAGAVVLSLVLPVIALIVALVMRVREHGPGRRILTWWAVAAAVWTCVAIVIGMILMTGLASGSSACPGGIDYAVPPAYSSDGGGNWTATYTCMDGGTVRQAAPSESMPMP